MGLVNLGQRLALFLEGSVVIGQDVFKQLAPVPFHQVDELGVHRIFKKGFKLRDEGAFGSADDHVPEASPEVPLPDGGRAQFVAVSGNKRNTTRRLGVRCFCHHVAPYLLCVLTALIVIPATWARRMRSQAILA